MSSPCASSASGTGVAAVSGRGALSSVEREPLEAGRSSTNSTAASAAPRRRLSADATAYAGSKPEGKLVIAGSSSVSPVMEKLIEAYTAVNAKANIELQTSDSTTGMTAAMDGTCDIGMASRELKEAEAEQLTGLAIAMDGIAVIVNTENPVQALSKAQITAIYTGDVTVWSDVE